MGEEGEGIDEGVECSRGLKICSSMQLAMAMYYLLSYLISYGWIIDSLTPRAQCSNESLSIHALVSHKTMILLVLRYKCQNPIGYTNDESPRLHKN